MLRELSQQLDAKHVEALARIRDERLFEAGGFDNFESFCREYIGVPRRTINQKIHEMETLGPDKFAIKQMVRVSKYDLELVNTESGYIVLDSGEKIPISDKTRPQVVAAVQNVIAEKRRADEELGRKQRELDRAKEAKDAAEAAAKKAREELDAIKTVRKSRWEHVDQDGQDLLDIMSELQFSLHRLRCYPAAHKNLSEENSERYVAACEYVWAELTAVVERGRAKFGVGMLAPRADITQEIDDYTPNKRDIVAEYINKYVK